jgi:hypothetical protein
VLDEPTVGLDPKSARLIKDILPDCKMDNIPNNLDRPGSPGCNVKYHPG